MSVIRVDNFGPSAGGTTYSARGIAKAWVNFNGQGTIAARDSENVSSLTDKGTGEYNVNYSNNMGNANYAIIATGDGTGVANVVNNDASPARSNTTATAGCGLSCKTSSANADLLYVYAEILGDLA